MEHRNTVLLHWGSFAISNEEQKLLSTLRDRKVKGYSRSVRFSCKIELLAEQKYIKYMHSLCKSNRELDKPVSKAEEPESEFSLYRESLDLNYFRSVGEELLGLHFWKQLKLDTILKKCGFNEKEAELAKIVILGRLLSPWSELHTLNWFNHESNLGDFSRL